MTDTTDELDFGFGSIVETTIRGHEVTGEVVATGPDNRDLDDDQYILALGWEADMNDDLNREEIVRERSITGVVENP